jgi:spore coat protein U-like protein
MKTFGRLAALLLAFAAAPSFAYNCSVVVTSITTVFDPNVNADNVSTGTYAITCTRAAGDSATLNWTLGANNGMNGSKVLGPNSKTYNYDLYFPPYASGNKWQDTNATRFTGQMVFGAVGSTLTQSGAFDLALPSPQGSGGKPAGTYSDAVTVTLRNGNNNPPLATANFTVSVITLNSCQIAVPPGNINFTYTSFQAAAATANTSFGVRCTDALPYTMALDAPPGPLLGLTYTLALSQTSGTGQGNIVQTYSINGSIAGGQAGTCATASCSGSQPRTVTVTY